MSRSFKPSDLPNPSIAEGKVKNKHRRDMEDRWLGEGGLPRRLGSENISATFKFKTRSGLSASFLGLAVVNSPADANAHRLKLVSLVNPVLLLYVLSLSIHSVFKSTSSTP
jgi:hypothetical protein